MVARYMLEVCGCLCRWALHELPNTNVEEMGLTRDVMYAVL